VTATNSLPPQSRNGNIVVIAAELVGLLGVDAASLSSSFDGTPGRWFNADMKYSRHRLSVSSSERHGDPSESRMVVPVTSFRRGRHSQPTFSALLGLDSRGSNEPRISLHGSQDPPKIRAFGWEGAIVGEGISGTWSTFSTLFFRWQQLYGRSLPVVQQLVVVAEGRLAASESVAWNWSDILPVTGDNDYWQVGGEWQPPHCVAR